MADFLGLVSDLDVAGVLRQAVDVAAAWTAADHVVVVGAAGSPLAARGVGDDEIPALLDALPGLEERAAALRARIDDHGEVFADLVIVFHETDAITDEHRLWMERLARVVGVAVRNARRFALSERRRESVEATARVTESLNPPYTLIDPLHRIVEGAQRIARASMAAVVRAGETGFDVAVASRHPSALTELLEPLHAAIRSAQGSGEVLESRHGATGTVAALPLNPELAFEGVVVVVLDHGRGRLAPDDRALLEPFVTHGSLVLDRVVLLQERQHEVVTADRDRIARDLHDIVIQRLFATGMKLQVTRHSDEPAEQREQVEEVMRDLDLTIRDIRSTIFELEHGREESLRASLAALVREYEPAMGFAPEVHTWGPLNTLVGRALADQALAVLREALSNCARHAAASHCTVEVSVDAGWLELEVTDDGRGAGTAQDRQETHTSGLRSLRRRAEALGGELIVAAGEARGTKVTWRVPITDQ